MSMYLNERIQSATPNQQDDDRRARQALCLARYVVSRRQELGLSIARAAELSGLEPCSWCLLEAGWVPDEATTIQAIAATLEVRWPDLDLLAVFARYAQGRC